MPAKLNITEGSRFGRWTVIEESPIAITKNGTRKHRSYICRCECGKEKAVLVSSLTMGRSLSCGCFHHEMLASMNYKHGLVRDRFYDLWANIKTRCYNKDSEDFVYYGARGIKMWDEWVNSPSVFVSYVKGLPESDNKLLTIDRINSDGDYAPNNLRWADLTIQARNQRLKKTNKTGYMGVYYNKRIKKFIATIRHNGKPLALARTNTAIEAHEIRRQFILDNNILGYNPDV